VIRRIMLGAGLSVAAFAAAVGLCAAEPQLTLRIPGFADATFPNFSSVVLPSAGYSTLDIVLQEALAPVQPSTVRVTLNGVPMTPFVSVNPMPLGLRAIVKLGLSMNPEYSIREGGETILALVATDEGGTIYRAQFYLTINPSIDAPVLAKSTRARASESSVQLPLQTRVPAIALRSDWPERTTERVLQLDADVSDAEGLRRIVIEVNGKDVEEVLLQNEMPVRRQNGRVVRGKLPGEVTGDGRHVRIALPVKLQRDRINVVAVRAENVAGLSSRADRTVEVPDR
jgi:hypothetical protein